MASRDPLYMLIINLVEEVQTAARNGTISMVASLGALADHMASQFGNPADLERVHQQVAAVMRERIIDTYKENVEANRHDYGDRSNSPARLSGRLLKALESESLVEGTVQGINFVDTDRLEQEARHYARLNFGTEGWNGAQGLPARNVPISLFGSTLFNVALTWGPSPGFSLPRGMFFDGNGWSMPDPGRRGEGTFYPLGELPTAMLRKRAAGFNNTNSRGPKLTKSIEARRFLDAGLEALAEELPSAYDRLLRKWTDTPPQLRELAVTVPTLRGGRVSLETWKLLR